MEVDIEAPAAMPGGGGGEALSGRQFKRPRKRIHSNNDLSRSLSHFTLTHGFLPELSETQRLASYMQPPLIRPTSPFSWHAGSFLPAL